MQSLSSCSLDPSDLQHTHALLRRAVTWREAQTEEDTEPFCKDVIVPTHPDGATLLQLHVWLTHRLATGQSHVGGLAVLRRPCGKYMPYFVHTDITVSAAADPLLCCICLGRTPHIVAEQLV